MKTHNIVDETLKKFDLENVEEQTDVEEIVDVEFGASVFSYCLIKKQNPLD